MSLWNGTPRERAQQVRAEFQIRQRAGLMIYLQQVESCYVLPLRCFSSSDGRKPTGAVQVDPPAAPSRPTAPPPLAAPLQDTPPQAEPMVLCGTRETL